MERLVEIALKNGAETAKVCGAGGGGCIAFLCAEGQKESVAAALSAEQDVQVLDWRFAPEGLIIRES
jgi:D-glycero-alpha-D-manno-heptose-7-phosphate kinase